MENSFEIVPKAVFFNIYYPLRIITIQLKGGLNKRK